MLFICTLIHNANHTIVLPWCASNWISLYKIYRNGSVAAVCCCCFSVFFNFLFFTVIFVAYYGLRFWHGCAYVFMTTDFLPCRVHCDVFDVRPNILQENRITLHMQSQCLLFSKPMSWCFDLLKCYLFFFCSSFTFKLSGTNEIQWIETLEIKKYIYPICVYMLVPVCASAYTFFCPLPLLSFTVFAQ